MAPNLMDWKRVFLLYEEAAEEARKKGKVHYVGFAKKHKLHPSYASQLLKEASMMNPDLIYRHGFLMTKEEAEKKLGAKSESLLIVKPRSRRVRRK